MDKITASITIDVEVFDKVALAKAALREALKTMKAHEWRALRRLTYNGVVADIQMLLDPGVSPDGLQIEDSSVVIHSFGDDDDASEC